MKIGIKLEYLLIRFHSDYYTIVKLRYDL